MITPEPARQARCRVHSRAGTLCANPALSDDPKHIQICVRHAAEVLELVREHQAAALTTTQETP